MSVEEDLAKIPELRDRATSEVLKKVLDEVESQAPRVIQWIHVPASGSAVCRYGGSGGGRTYEVRYQSGDLGNLVHELTHVAVNESYGLDFVNYPSRKEAQAPPRTFDTAGRCTNEFERQTALMEGDWNARIGLKLGELLKLTKKSSLATEHKPAVEDKLRYGGMWPHKEYDTVIHQILVWLYEWGCAVKGAPGNRLFRGFESAVDRAHGIRTSSPGSSRRKIFKP